jgi:uncharacterized repeat protein (TIGR03803 family)
LIQATDGNFYGVHYTVLHQNGEVFRMTPAGKVTPVYAFCSQAGCPDGSVALNPLLGSDGNLYGVALGGGNSSSSGTIYKVTLDGTQTTLYQFCPNSGCADGQSPNAITQASDGNFYGTTPQGGANSAGTIFSISPSGDFKLLYTFCSLANCADGEFAESSPIQGSDGNFYGVTSFGGTGGAGVAYKLTAAGAYSVLYNFCSDLAANCPDGSHPVTLTQGPAGNLFGITNRGGLKDCGTIFRLTPDNQYIALHRFQDSVDGCNPFGGLTWANDGNFYGVAPTAEETLSSGGGFLYQMKPGGAFKTLYTFKCCTTPHDPNGMLFQGTNGDLYGYTLYNGNQNNCCIGTIYDFSNHLSPLVETVPIAGNVGHSVIILGNGLTGTSSVTFNGTPATFSVASDTEITATVPTGAKSGTVSVVTPSGTLHSNPAFRITN